MKGIVQLFLMLVLSPLFQSLTLVAQNSSISGVQWASDGKSYVYSHFLTGISSIQRVGSDGSQASTLVPLSEVAMARLSPDGSQIVYGRTDDSGYSLQIMNADGSEDRQLIPLDARPSFISWAPDSSKILVQSGETFVINPDGTGKTIFDSQVGGNLMWSPDSRRIAFENSTTTELWVMDADGSNAHALFSVFGNASNFSWSPDGQKIAFTYYIFTCPRCGPILYGLAHVNANDGSGYLEVVFATQDQITSYQWSPDSSRIAYVANGMIRIAGASGSDLTYLASGSSNDGQPTWSPDGEQIAFVSDRDNAAELYVVSASGGQAQRLTTNDTLETSIRWSPDSTFLVFESQQPDRTELFDVSVSGESEQLLSAQLNVFFSLLSPNGQRIAIFSRAANGGIELYTVNRDGSELTWWSHITELYPSGYYHRWSPNSDYFAYIDGQSEGNRLYVLDMQKGELFDIAAATGTSSQGGVIWWPDCSRIAFFTDGAMMTTYPTGAIITTRPDGSDMMPFAGGMEFSMLSSTPNADSIAAVGRDNDKLAIYLVDVVSQIATKLVTVDAVSIDIMDWSPNGRHIRYRAYQEMGDHWEGGFYLLDTVSGKVFEYNELGNWVPSQWSPDGHYLLNADDAIHVYTPDGKEHFQFEIPRLGEFGWAADGNHLYYVQQFESNNGKDFGLYVMPIQ